MYQTGKKRLLRRRTPGTRPRRRPGDVVVEQERAELRAAGERARASRRARRALRVAVQRRRPCHRTHRPVARNRLEQAVHQPQIRVVPHDRAVARDDDRGLERADAIERGGPARDRRLQAGERHRPDHQVAGDHDPLGRQVDDQVGLAVAGAERPDVDEPCPRRSVSRSVTAIVGRTTGTPGTSLT